jgi:hypothetical protein
VLNQGSWMRPWRQPATMDAGWANATATWVILFPVLLLRKWRLYQHGLKYKAGGGIISRPDSLLVGVFLWNLCGRGSGPSV